MFLSVNCDRRCTGILPALGYSYVMKPRLHYFKYIVAAFCLWVGFSIPLAAQNTKLDDWHAELLTADVEQSAWLVDRITGEWAKSGSAAMDLLLMRGKNALQANDLPRAVEHFSALIDHAPDFAEAYNSRATAYFHLGYLGPSLDDIRITLSLNPRHFGALSGFGMILNELGRKDEALQIYDEVLAIYPHAQGIIEARARLLEELQGQTL